MDGSSHMAIGMAVAGCALGAMHAAGVPLETGQIAIGVGCGALGGLAPDIDHRMSKISFGIPAAVFSASLSVFAVNWFVSSPAFARGSISAALVSGIPAALTPIIRWAWLGLAVSLALLLVSIVASRFLGHRGVTHSIGAALAGTFVASLAAAHYGPWWFGLLFGAGYASHLAADLTSSMGLPRLMWPFDMMAIDLRGPARLVAPQATPAGDSSSQDSELATPQPVNDLMHPDRGTTPDPAESPRRCPWCGRKLVLRTPKSGQAWDPFWGCSGYPRCRYTEKYAC